MTEIADYREILGSRYQPPADATDIIASLMTSKIIVPRWRHHSGGQVYPSYSFNRG